MGVDLSGIERGSCRVCVELGDVCLGYVLPPNAETLSIPNCRDCNHKPSNHKVVSVDNTGSVEGGQAATKKKKETRQAQEPELFKNRKLGYIEHKGSTDNVLDMSYSETKNKVVEDLYKSKFKNGYSLRNPKDMKVFQRDWVDPELKRRMMIKKKLHAVNSKAEYFSSENDDAAGGFAHSGYTPNPSHIFNLNRQMEKVPELYKLIGEIKLDIEEYENNNITDSETNKIKVGTAPNFRFNSDVKTKLIDIENSIDRMDGTLIGLKQKFAKVFPIQSSSKIRDPSRAAKEDRRKYKKKYKRNRDESSSDVISPEEKILKIRQKLSQFAYRPSPETNENDTSVQDDAAYMEHLEEFEKEREQQMMLIHDRSPPVEEENPDK